MTVYPFILHLGSFEITGYGLMMMVAFLMGGWLIGLELRRRQLAEDYAADMVAAAVVGGIIGAKLWYVVLTRDPGAIFSRGGLVWYGGFIGGALAVILNGWRLRVPLRWTMHLAAPALAAAYALGRVGCFLVNDDYGRPSSLPWAMKFPRGLPATTAGNMQQLFGIPVPPGTDPGTVLAVHPTQLYETAIMLGVFMVLWRLRTSERADRMALRALPGARRAGAFPGRDPARQGRPLSGPLHHRPAHQRDPDCDRRGAAVELVQGRQPGPGGLSGSWQEGVVVQFLDSCCNLLWLKALAQRPEKRLESRQSPPSRPTAAFPLSPFIPATNSIATVWHRSCS